MGTIILSQEFKRQLKEFCSDKFIESHIKEIQGRDICKYSNDINLIDVTDFLRNGNTISRVQFCLVWLRSIASNVPTPQCGIVIIDDISYTSMKSKDFLCYLTNMDLISNEQRMQFESEWLDFTNGKPYYDLPIE